MENETITTTIELARSLRLYGELTTFRVPGLIVNGALIIISLTLLINFSITLIILIAQGIFVLIFLYIQFGLINKATRAMRKSCKFVLKDDQIKITVGFPHNFDHTTTIVKKEDITQLQVKGNSLFGYYVEFFQVSVEKELERISKISVKQRIRRGIKKPYSARFGLWRSPEDAIEHATKLSKLMNLQVVEDYSIEDDKG